MAIRHPLTLIAGLVLSASLASGQQQAKAQATDKGSVALPATLAPVYDAHERLATQFRGLWSAAIASGATASEREAFVQFLRAEVVAQLEGEGIVLYPVFDSLTGSHYATTAALFDRQAIGRLVDELRVAVQSPDRGTLETRSYALAVALESYFTKTEFLVLSVVNDRLNGDGVRALLARLDGARKSS